MGNVFAASAPPSGAFAAPDPPPPPVFGGGDIDKNQNEGEWPHPGVMEDLHKRTRGMYLFYTFP